MHKVLAVLLVVGTLGFGMLGRAEAQESAPGSLEEARAMAAEAQKPLLVEFSTDWCVYCKVFAKDEETDDQVKAAVDGFVLYKIDAEKGDGIELAKEYRIQGYPTFVAENAAGKTLDRWYGYSKNMFLTQTAEVQADPSTVEEKMARFESDPNADDAVRIARYYETTGEYKDAIDSYRAAQKLDEDPDADYTMEIFEATFYAQRKDLVPMEDLQASAGEVLESPETSDGDVITIALMMRSSASRAENMALAAPYVQTAVERTAESEDPEVQQQRAKLLPDYTILVEKDEAKGVALKKQGLNEGWMDDPDALNGFAWWCYMHRVNLEEAFTLAQRGVELAGAPEDKAEILDTVAEICNAKGDCQNAIVYIQQAIELNPGRDYYKRQLTKFEEALAEAQGGN